MTDPLATQTQTRTQIDELQTELQALRASESRIREALDFLPLLFWTARPDGYVDSCNNGWCAYTGMTREETFGNGWTAALHPEDARTTSAAVGEAFGQGKMYEVEQRLRRHDGAYRWFLVRGTPLRDPAGGIIRWHGANVDIHDRMQADTLLRAGGERHRTILHTSMDGFWMLDPSGRLLEVNEAYCRMSGYSAQELLAMRVSDLEASESAAAAAAHLEKILETGQDRFESRHRRKDGSHFDVEVSVQFRSGEVGYLAAFLKDVTQRKRAEEERSRLQEQLMQAQKMESVGRLAGGVAHDFNNMLGVILGHLELALEEVDPALPLHADLADAHKAAKRSADLTRQLLAFARKQTIAPRALDLNEAVGGLLQMQQRLIGENVRLEWRPGPGLWSVLIDPSQFAQILTNLCINARDAISGTGRVIIETCNRALTAVDCAAHNGLVPGDYVLVGVSDDGSGMDQEVLSHLFEPFFTTKEMGKGTGLGLATVYGNVKQNHGYVAVASELGRGTNFSIYLPRHSGGGIPAALQLPAGLERPATGTGTVLLVEDEPAVLALATRLLQRQGYTVLAAGTPADGIRLAKAHRDEIHLLVTDVIMPEMSGPDLARSLQGDFPKLKRLFISGYTANVLAEQGVLDEGTHFLQKPFSEQELARSVRAALGA